MKQNWVMRFGRGLVLLGSGGMVLGNSCSSDVRNSIVSAELDFIESTASLVLETLFPVEDVLTQP